MTCAELPHSGISGSTPVSGSPKLFAAVHVLRRLSMPRHPPRALSSFSFTLRHASNDWRPGFVASRSSRQTLTLVTRLRSTKTLEFRIRFSENSRVTLRATKPPNSKRRREAEIFGGADRVRTDDFRLAKPALSQLSYSPKSL